MIIGGVPILLLAFAGGAVDPGVAESDVEPVALPSPTRQLSPAPRHWYGWQLAISDVGFLTMGTLAARGRLTWVATAGLGLGGPVLHLANGHWKMGLASVLVRTTLISAVALAGGRWTWLRDRPRCTSDPEICDATPSLGGLEIAALGAAGLLAAAGVFLLDDTIGSLEGWPTPSAPVGRARAKTIAPTFSATTSGVSMGLVGTF